MFLRNSSRKAESLVMDTATKKITQAATRKEVKRPRVLRKELEGITAKGTEIRFEIIVFCLFQCVIG